MDERDVDLGLEDAINAEKQRRKNEHRSISQQKRRGGTQDEGGEDEVENDDDDEVGGYEPQGGVDEVVEIGEALVEALYSSSGRNITDVLDYHLSKISKSLISIQKQNARILQIQMSNNPMM